MRAGAVALVALVLAGCNQVLGLDEPGPSSALTGLVPSKGTLDPPFDPDVLAYHLDLSVIAQQVTLTPLGPATLDVRIADTATPIGTPSAPIDLPLGTSLVTVAAGPTTYTIDVDRGAIDPVAHRLASTAPVPGGLFGLGLAVDGDRVAVGAPGESPGQLQDCDGAGPGALAVDAGAVYLFVRTPDGYALEQRLERPADLRCSLFGATVALDGDRLLVGDWSESVDDQPSAGAVHVYERRDGVWTYARRLIAPGAPAGARFGVGLAAGGGAVLVGAPGLGANNGQAFAFSGADLSDVQLLAPHASGPAAQIGYAIAIDGARAVVGAPSDTGVVPYQGSVGMYELDGGSWTLRTVMFATSPEAIDYAGLAVALDGDRVVAGAPLAGPHSGEVHAFAKTDDQWLEVGELKAAGAEAEDMFGNQVSIAGDLIAVGWCAGNVDLAGWSTAEPTASGPDDAGAAMLYDATTTPPTFVGALGRDLPVSRAYFGCINQLTRDRLILGGHGEDARAGAAYVVE